MLAQCGAGANPQARGRRSSTASEQAQSHNSSHAECVADIDEVIRDCSAASAVSQAHITSPEQTR